MGDPRRLRKKFERPKKLWDSERIKEEQRLMSEYGLKNVRELWVMKQELKKIRREVRRILSLGEKGEKKGKLLLNKLKKLGLAKDTTKIEELLSLNIRDILERRLETMVFKKGFSTSLRQSRQLITHGFIGIGGRKISAPSYLVPADKEDKIECYK